jgi:hypothetical protein
MSQARRTPNPLPDDRPAAARQERGRALPRERAWVVLLLALHLALVVWGALRNSVTFDENFHLPAGVLIVARGDYAASRAQPPLAKVLCALPVLALGARLPAEEAIRQADEAAVGESFMRRNADRFHALYFAGRMVTALLSLLLALLVWRAARGRWGPRGGRLALGLYAFAPEVLAHAGLVGMDLPTALTMTAAVLAFARFGRTGTWGAWGWLALATAAAFLTRFSAAQLVPILGLLAVTGTVTRRLARPGRVWLGLTLLVPVVWVALAAGYAGQLYPGPLSGLPFRAHAFQRLAQALPGLHVFLPVHYLSGLDYVASFSQPGLIHPYLLGRTLERGAWYYFPLALLFKWPLGFLGALLLAKAAWFLRRGLDRDGWEDTLLLLPVVVMLAAAMMATSLGVGVRYLLPILPLLCIWMGGLMLERPGAQRPSAWARAAVALAMLQAVETGLAAPWYLSFFNGAAGGPGGGYRLVNDSNVDWGQGLIALRDEMKERGIARVHLAYHGTTDPAVYGIDYVPYTGGMPGPESEWLAVSSYYFVGLTQRMMTQQGRTPPLAIDFRPLWSVKPAARPGDCIYLFPLHRPR